MAIRRLALGVVAVLAVMGVVVAVIVVARSSGDGTTRSKEKSDPAASAGVYAYIRTEFGQSWLDTKGELVVMNGTKKVGSAPFGLIGSRPDFTADGRYAFTLLLSNELGVVSAKSGRTTTTPCKGCSDRNLECQCQTVVPIGGSEVAWLDRDERLVRMDLAAKSPTPEKTDITLPVQDGFLDEKIKPNLIAGSDGKAIAAYPHGSLPGDDQLPVYLVTLDDKPRKLHPERPDSVEEAVFSPDGTQVMLTGNQEYACASVTVVDVASGKGETAPVSADPGTKCTTNDVYIDAMWWDDGGTPGVYFQANDDEPASKNGQRRLKGDEWVEPAADPGIEVRQLSAGATARLDDWTLTLEAGGKRTKIDTKVRYLVVAPH